MEGVHQYLELVTNKFNNMFLEDISNYPHDNSFNRKAEMLSANIVDDGKFRYVKMRIKVHHYKNGAEYTHMNKVVEVDVSTNPVEFNGNMFTDFDLFDYMAEQGISFKSMFQAVLSQIDSSGTLENKLNYNVIYPAINITWNMTPETGTWDNTDPAEPIWNGNMDGAITLDVTGGNGTYTYSWNTGDTTQSVSGYPSGTYTVVVTDSVGNTASSGAIDLLKPDNN